MLSACLMTGKPQIIPKSIYNRLLVSLPLIHIIFTSGELFNTMFLCEVEGLWFDAEIASYIMSADSHLSFNRLVTAIIINTVMCEMSKHRMR